MESKFHQERIKHHLERCLDSIMLARTFIDGFSESQFLSDKKTIYAVTRCIDILTIKSTRIQDTDTNGIYADNLPLKKIIRMKSIIDVSYGEINPLIIWKTVNKDFEYLENVFKKQLLIF